MPEDSSKSNSNSPSSVVDHSLTADTTPCPEDESHSRDTKPVVGSDGEVASPQPAEQQAELDRAHETQNKAKKRPARSSLEILLADHDWYITFERESKRASSIKRQQERIAQLSNGMQEPEVKEEDDEMTEEEKAAAEMARAEAKAKRAATLERNMLQKRLASERAREKRELMKKLRAEGKLPQRSKTNADPVYMKELVAGAQWFNRDADIDTYTRKIKPKTEWFIIPDFRTDRISKKNKKEDSVLTSRGHSGRVDALKKQKKTVIKKAKKVAKKKKKTVAKQEVEEDVVEEEEEEETIVEEQFNWFLDTDVVEGLQGQPASHIDIGDRQLFIDEVYRDKTIALDYSTLEESSDDNLVSAAQLVAHFEKSYYNTPEFPYKEVSLSTLFSNYKEQYILRIPKDHGLHPFIELGATMELTAVFYLPETYRLKVRNDQQPEESIVGRYVTAFHNSDFAALVQQIDSYNSLIDDLRLNHWDEICAHLKGIKKVPRCVFHEVLNQSYSRTVSPNVRSLRSYKAFSNETYGELLPSLLALMYQQTNLDHTKTFMDLGSGVGNCTLQAALEYGCESYGCELMSNASKLSALQLLEFNKRCRIFGLKPGAVENFLDQSFVDNEAVSTAVNKCDVILCNNYLFDADLNMKCVELFRNLKTGTKIITLKPLVPLGYSFDENDVESILNRTRVEKFKYGANSVSWTDKGGEYYINHVQADIVSDYFVERAKGRTSRTRHRSSDMFN